MGEEHALHVVYLSQASPANWLQPVSVPGLAASPASPGPVHLDLLAQRPLVVGRVREGRDVARAHHRGRLPAHNLAARAPQAEVGGVLGRAHAAALDQSPGRFCGRPAHATGMVGARVEPHGGGRCTRLGTLANSPYNPLMPPLPCTSGIQWQGWCMAGSQQQWLGSTNGSTVISPHW